MDVEGTTTSKDFVFKVLFPYAYQALPSFVKNHANEKEVSHLLSQLEKKIDSNNLDAQIDFLLECIKLDIKDPVLKALQGLIWEEGYTSGKIKSHVYADVPLAFHNWKKQDLLLAIYSSGSVLAQKLLFKYAEMGDLTSYLSHHFDTAIGGKKDILSYQNIGQELTMVNKEILFLSDIEEELVAAEKADMQVILVNRDKMISSGQFVMVDSFSNIKIN